MLDKLNKKNWDEMIDIQSEWAQNKAMNILKEIYYYEDAVVDNAPLEYSPNEFNEEKLIKFRLCYLASESDDWWAEDAFQFLHDKRVKKDLWKTYLAFTDAFKEAHCGLDILPKVYEYEDEVDETILPLDKRISEEFKEIGFQIGWLKGWLTKTPTNKHLLIIVIILLLIISFRI